MIVINRILVQDREQYMALIFIENNILIKYLNWKNEEGTVNFDNLILKMSYHHKHSLKRRKNSNDYPQPLKFPPHDQIEKDPLFFTEGQHQYKSELEMPIKIEGDLRYQKSLQRQNRMSQYPYESSDHVENNEIYEQSESKNQPKIDSKEAGKDDYDILMNPQSKIDAIDALLMPLYDPNLALLNENNHYIMYEQPEVKEQELNSNQLPPPGQQAQHMGQAKIPQGQKNSILTLMNSFRAFYQATTVSINFHKLAKKDSLNKVYNSIFNVLAKQNKRMLTQLQKERTKVQVSCQRNMQCQGVQIKNEALSCQNNELIKTGYEDGLQVKKEHIEPNNSSGK